MLTTIVSERASKEPSSPPPAIVCGRGCCLGLGLCLGLGFGGRRDNPAAASFVAIAFGVVVCCGLLLVFGWLVELFVVRQELLQRVRVDDVDKPTGLLPFDRVREGLV